MPNKSSQTLRQQVGQLMIMGFNGTELSSHLQTMLATLRPGGVILFRRNIDEARQTHILLHDVQKFVRSPLFRCVDMEGGTVDRFRDAVARVPSAGEVAATGSAKLFREHGLLIGLQSRALGFNADLAPCLDLELDASRKTLGSRTVSADPAEVVRYARQFLNGLHEASIIGCGKHFPGLGGAALDSHHALPVVERTWKQIWNKDLLPYRELCREFAFVMVAHVSYPKIVRGGRPASLSKRWVEGVLRKKIGYRGLVVSDDLDMGGVLNGASIEDVAVGTLEAGADVFLVCQKEEHVWRAHAAVLQRAEGDPRFARLVAQKARRVASFQAKSPEVQARMAPAPTEKSVDRLRRRVWDFTEEVRRSTIFRSGECAR
ncbi:MAG TPA: beta-N-acetylhexosaminidase [Candidatus Binatia bacterium]|nr:beta-N-acetylhexosaminidase [Candidatus Binatia bacterium]